MPPSAADHDKTERMHALLWALQNGAVQLRALAREHPVFAHHEAVRRCCVALHQVGLVQRTANGAWQWALPVPREGALIGGTPVLAEALSAVTRQTGLTTLAHGARGPDGQRHCLGLCPARDVPGREYLRSLARSGPTRSDAVLLTTGPLTARSAPGAVILAHAAGGGPRNAELARIRSCGYACTRVPPMGWWALSVPVIGRVPLAGALSVLSPRTLRDAEIEHLREVLTIAARQIGRSLGDQRHLPQSA